MPRSTRRMSRCSQSCIMHDTRPRSEHKARYTKILPHVRRLATGSDRSSDTFLLPGNPPSCQSTTRQKVTIILWLFVGDLLGTYILLFQPKSGSLIVAVGSKLVEILLAYNPSMEQRRKMADSKEDGPELWLPFVACVFTFLVGLVVAILAAHTIAIQILDFGNCSPMSI